MNEKVLLVGFGIFTIISCLSILNPYFNNLFEYHNHQANLDNIYQNIEKIDNSLKYSSTQNETYTCNIFIFENLNLTINQLEVKYSYFLIKKVEVLKSYETRIENDLIVLKSKTNYTLKIYHNDTGLKLEFISQY